MTVPFEILKDSCDIGTVRIAVYASLSPEFSGRQICYSPGTLLVDIHDHSKMEFLDCTQELKNTFAPTKHDELLLNLLTSLGRDAYFYSGSKYNENSQQSEIYWTLYGPQEYSPASDKPLSHVTVAAVFPQIPTTTSQQISENCERICKDFASKIQLEYKNKEKYIEQALITKACDALYNLSPAIIQDIQSILNTNANLIKKRESLIAYIKRMALAPSSPPATVPLTGLPFSPYPFFRAK